MPGGPSAKVTGMVTRIHHRRKARLFLREWRKAKGVSATVMGRRLGMERESVLRLEREWNRCAPDKQAQYADALGIQPEALWHPPVPDDRPSLDAMTRDIPDDVRDMVVDVVRRMTGRG